MVQDSGGGVTLPSAYAAYAFSEGSGLTTADASGNGRTLTLNGTSWATGHTGGGITNTTTALGASAAFTAPTSAITLMAWIRPLNLDSGTSHFAFGFISLAGSTQAAIFTQRSDFGTSNVLQCDLRLAGNLSAFHGPALTLNTWAHVAVTYDSSATTLVIYVDGTAVLTSNSASGSVSAGDEFRVAGWNANSPYDTDVIVDDVRVFNSALTSEQVTLAMNTPVS